MHAPVSREHFDVAAIAAAFAVARRRAIALQYDASSRQFIVDWEHSAAIAQRIETAVSPLDVAAVTRRYYALSYEPHLAAFHPTPTGNALSIVFEPFDPRRGPYAEPRVLAAPRAFRDAKGALFTATLSAQGPCLWLAATQTPSGGVEVATVHAPKSAPFVGWSVHVHDRRGSTWAEHPEAQLLRSISREVVAIDVSPTQTVSLFRDERSSTSRADLPSPRVFRVSDVHLVRSSPYPSDGEAALDDWMLARMRASGARHAQLAIVRGDDIAFARAYTDAEADYPPATLEHALRLGSVTKSLVALVALRALRDDRLPSGLDTSLGRIFDAAFPPAHPFGAVTLRGLLRHESGLPSFADLSPTNRDNPLSEAKVARALGRPRARPGDLSLALASLDASAILTSSATTAYSNEGFTLLGEALAHHLEGRRDALGDLLAGLFTSVGVETDPRGVLAATTAELAKARNESPAHATGPSFRRASFAADDPALVDLAYATNLPFLGGAAGLAVPVMWIARLLAGLSRSDGGLAPALAPCLADIRAGARATYGFYAGEPGWFKVRASDPALGARTFRSVCLHNNGRVEGGAALLMIRAPLEPHPDHPVISVIAAMNQLGDLYEDPHGRELFGILRRLEGSRA